MTERNGVSPTSKNHCVGVIGGGVDEEETEVHDPDARSSKDDCPDEDRVDMEPQEDAPVKIARDPGDPTPQEREEHNATHMPYRSWCPVCVKAKGKEEAHRSRKSGDKSCKATISFDYKTFGQEEDEDDKATAIVYKDDKTKMIFGHACECKGASDAWVMRKIEEDINRLGHKEVIVKGDGEPALVQVLEKIKEARSGPTIIQNPPAYDPQANGAAEKAVQDYMGQVRALKIGLEARLKCKVESDWKILEWITELAGELVNRGQVGKDGRTAYYRLYGRNSTKGLVEIGEQVMAKPLRGRRSQKKLSLKERWVFATWVGIDPKTNEHVVVVSEGGAAIRVRTVLRRSVGDRWNVDAIKTIRASPRMPNPKDESQTWVMPERLTRKIEVGEDGSSIPEQANQHREFKFREFKITKGILEKFGFSDNCKGCEAAALGKDARRHSDDCRARIEKQIREDEVLKVRLDMRDIRLNKDDKEQDGLGKEQVDIEKMIGEEESVGDAVVKELIVNEDNVVSSGIEGTHSGDGKQETKKEDASQERKRREHHGETEQADAKKRRLRLLVAEGRLSERIRHHRSTGGSRRKLHAMLRALEFGPQAKTEAKFDISEMIGAIREEEGSPHDDKAEEERWRAMYEEVDFWDDMNDMKPLNWEMAVKARKLEMDFFKKMGVYEKVPREVAKKLGCKVITTKWLDTNKGDELRPNYRSRLVGREIKYDKRLDLFSATPPLEALKFLCSVCARGQGGPRPLRLAAVDIKRAYFYAPARRPIFIEIPAEDQSPGDEQRVGRLKLSLYGTRDAAQNWAHEYPTFLKGLGFEVGRASPCNFVHKTRNIYITVHGDDFTIVADDGQLQWIGREMRGRYELKMDVLGPDDGQSKEVRILNRTIRWTAQGIQYEPDQRHAKRIIAELGLDKCRAVQTPSVPEGATESKMNAEKDHRMETKEATLYRALAARLNYLAADRPDLLFASKCISKHMADPHVRDWEALKRVGRYLKGAVRLVQNFNWAEMGDAKFQGFADSDWAGDRRDMKSTSGGTIMWGSHCLKAWSTSQSTVALSSGEAELYAMTKMATQISGMISMAADFGIIMAGEVKSDSNAAIGIAHRDGLGGRCRHIRVQYLWIQSRIKDGDLKLVKVPGTSNLADIMTKAISKELMDKYLDMMGYVVKEGAPLASLRSALTPESRPRGGCKDARP